MSPCRLTLLLILGVIPAASVCAAEFLSFEKADKALQQFPYVREYQASSGALLLFGVRHTWDPDDAQVSELKKRWASFKPTVVYFEGDGWSIGDSLHDSVRQHGEQGFVRHFALMNRVPVATLEPDFADEIGSLKPQWSDEQIKVFYALRPVATNQQPVSDEQMKKYLRAGFPRSPGVSGPPETLKELATSAEKLLGIKGWRPVSLSLFEPNKKVSFTNDIARASCEYRDRFMLKTLSDRVRRGDRVLVVVGATHVARQEPLFSSEFELRLSK